MAYWLIQITDDGLVPDLLPFLFNHQQGLATNFIKEDGNYYLKIDDANSQKTIKDVDKEADEWLSFLNGNISFHCGVAGTLHRTGSVIYSDRRGRQAGTATKNFAARVRIMDPLPQSVIAKQPNFLETQVLAKDSEVLKALRYYTDMPNWSSLYKIYEIIRNDCYKDRKGSEAGKKAVENFHNVWTRDATGSPRENDFTESANNPHLSGPTARHSYSHEHKPLQDPKNPQMWIVKKKNGKEKTVSILPMSLDEAKIFIDKLLEEWLKNKQRSFKH